MTARGPLLGGTAFITGAGSGIGQYTAFAFANNGVQNFGLTDIKPENLQSTVQKLQELNKNVEIEAIEMDVANEQGVISAIERTANRFGRIDYAINNAGIEGPLVPTADMELQGWVRCLDVNITGLFLCQREEIRQMLQQSNADTRQGRGVIVNVASMLGLIGVSPNLPSPAYVTSKHAVMGLTKTDGIFYGKKGIRINAICPGYVATPLLMKHVDTPNMNVELEKVPLGRLAKMEEIADAIVFLASPMSSFMCASALVVDGGYTAQ